MEDEYMKLIVEMVGRDYQESPYTNFEQYWRDHTGEWAKCFTTSTWCKLLNVLNMKYDIYPIA